MLKAICNYLSKYEICIHTNDLTEVPGHHKQAVFGCPYCLFQNVYVREF